MSGESDATLSLLADVATGFATPDVGRVRKLRADGRTFDRDVWGRLAEQGWLSILVPEALGGAGHDERAVAVIAEALGYGAYLEPFVAAGVMTPQCLALAPESEFTRRALERVLAGDLVAAVAWQGDDGSLDVAASGVAARPAGEGYALSGVARWVPVAEADAFIVSAGTDRTEDGLVLVWVDRNQPGLEVASEPLADGAASARLTFTDAAVPDAAVLASGPAAAETLRAVVDTALVAVSAELVGVMRRALDLTLDYLRARRQFGRPIGSYQALQHRAVDMWIRLRLARAALDGALQARHDPSADPEARTAAASSAKARASGSAQWLCNQAVQLHGAIGFTDEYDLGHYVNRGLVLSAWLGNAAAHTRRYADLVPLGEAR